MVVAVVVAVGPVGLVTVIVRDGAPRDACSLTCDQRDCSPLSAALEGFPYAYSLLLMRDVPGKHWRRIRRSPVGSQNKALGRGSGITPPVSSLRGLLVCYGGTRRGQVNMHCVYVSHEASSIDPTVSRKQLSKLK